MSNSEAFIDLTARWPMTELALVDTTYCVVAKGVGHLTGTVSPGLYELRTIAGHQRHKRIIHLRASQSYVDDDVVVPFSPVAPVTEADMHLADCVTGLSRTITTSAPGASAIVVFLRGKPGQDLDPAHVELLDDEVRGVAEPADGWGGWARRVVPGSHVMRYHVDPEYHIDVPVWTQKHWQTVVFVPCVGGRPVPAEAVTHLRSLTEPWTSDVNVDIPLELLLQGLAGHGAVPQGMDSTHNPMLMLTHATTLAVNEKDAAKDEFNELRNDLERLLPDHPDVAAIRLAGRPRLASPASVPPTLAPLLWRTLLPADHDGLEAIAPGSRLEQIIPAAVPNGPWVAWRQLERSAQAVERRVEIYRRTMPQSGGRPDARQIAQAVGLTSNCVRGVIAGPDVDRFAGTISRLIDTLSSQNLLFTVPDRVDFASGDMVVQTNLTVPGMARLSIESRRDDIEVYLATQHIPMILSGPDDVHQLVELTNGAAAFPAEHSGPYRLRLGQTSHTGGHRSYEAVAFDPRMAPAFGTERRVSRQRTVVAHHQFELDLFEDTSRNIQLAVHSQTQVESQAFVLVSVRLRREDNETSEDLAVPLTWLARQGVSSGALRIGSANFGMTVFVVPHLVDPRTIGVDVLQRSLKRFANKQTRQALIRAIDLAGEQENNG
ncbi:hypothetical protein [Amycolatopsis sp. cmx-4-68]|uniref:hypothetical protein n=1 Tax=Amycolatopsis sp. cmx-4-68 TaxID=2790938 RepID=UPI00397E43FD